MAPQVATRFQMASKAASLGTVVPMTVLWVDASASQPSFGPAVLLAMSEEPATLAARNDVGAQAAVGPATPAAAWAALAKPALAASRSSWPCRAVDPEPHFTAAAAGPKPHSKLPLPTQGALPKAPWGTKSDGGLPPPPPPWRAAKAEQAAAAPAPPPSGLQPSPWKRPRQGEVAQRLLASSKRRYPAVRRSAAWLGLAPDYGIGASTRSE